MQRDTLRRSRIYQKSVRPSRCRQGLYFQLFNEETGWVKPDRLESSSIFARNHSTSHNFEGVSISDLQFSCLNGFCNWLFSWFTETASFYRPIAMIELLSNTTSLGCIVFQMDLVSYAAAAKQTNSPNQFGLSRYKIRGLNCRKSNETDTTSHWFWWLDSKHHLLVRFLLFRQTRLWELSPDGRLLVPMRLAATARQTAEVLGRYDCEFAEAAALRRLWHRRPELGNILQGKQHSGNVY